MKKCGYILILLVSLTKINVAAQTFSSAIETGVNFSKVTSTNNGFNFVAPTFGVVSEFYVDGDKSLSTGVFYSKRGEHIDREHRMALHYLEIPATIKFHGWKKDNYHRVHVLAGTSIGYLFKIEESNFLPLRDPENIRNWDISWRLGLGFRFHNKWSTRWSVTRSIRSIYQNPDVQDARLFGYYLTLKMIFHL